MLYNETFYKYSSYLQASALKISDKLSKNFLSYAIFYQTSSASCRLQHFFN